MIKWANLLSLQNNFPELQALRYYPFSSPQANHDRQNKDLPRSTIPWWLSHKESTCNAVEVGLIPGTGRSPGEGNGNLLQYSCLEKPMDRGA